jgi:DNA mismatch repair protein MutS
MLFYGIAVVNIFTGCSSLFEHTTPFQMNATVFDELERHVSVHQPSEIVIVSSFSESDIRKVLQYSGIHTPAVHIYETTHVKAQRCASERYLSEIISTVFADDTYNTCAEFREHVFATQAFGFLLNFIQEHTPALVKRIALPEFNNTSERMVLANHTLKQLNIIPDPSNHPTGQYASVLSLLNKCSSAMGKRLFQEQLTTPTFREAWLEREYDMTAQLMLPENYELVDIYRQELRKVRDVEKLTRQIITRRMYPSSVYHLYTTLDIVRRLQNERTTSKPLHCTRPFTTYLCDDLSDDPMYILQICHSGMSFLDQCLNIAACKTVDSMTSFDENIIQTGISIQLDDKVRQWNENKTAFQAIKDGFNKLVQRKENLAGDVEYIKTHETEKSGAQLQITAKRSVILKAALTEAAVDGKIITLDGNRVIHIDDIKFTKTSATSSTMNIQMPLLDRLCRELVTMKDEINVLIAETYQQVLKRMEEEHVESFRIIGAYIAKLDVLACKAYIAKRFHYCRPVLVTDAAKSFVDASELRHCLIEHVQQNELYVTNDVGLGATEQPDGMLLYGTNAVGKTSLIRALGISVVMAQAGIYVPCTHFRYKPYMAIYSRILATDNLFKGLSTFAVEMSELRVILRSATENSLILGDELCSGTETESALSIFVAGLMQLHAKGSSFIFATHFHEIVNYDEITSLTRLVMKHMAVIFDREKDCLVYDRRLRDGSGPRMYGLEVCKSLQLGDDFLELANSIRNKYYPDTQGILSQDTSRYNANKIRGLCEKCGVQISSEVHHLLQQKYADEDGFIGAYSKNHPANLMNVCEACHTDIHAGQSEWSRKKTTKGYQIMKN